MHMTVKQFSDLVTKVAESRAAYSSGSLSKTWHVEDLAVIYSTVAEDVALTLVFALDSGLVTDEKS